MIVQCGRSWVGMINYYPMELQVGVNMQVIPLRIGTVENGIYGMIDRTNAYRIGVILALIPFKKAEFFT